MQVAVQYRLERTLSAYYTSLSPPSWLNRAYFIWCEPVPELHIIYPFYPLQVWIWGPCCRLPSQWLNISEPDWWGSGSRPGYNHVLKQSGWWVMPLRSVLWQTIEQVFLFLCLCCKGAPHMRPTDELLLTVFIPSCLYFSTEGSFYLICIIHPLTFELLEWICSSYLSPRARVWCSFQEQELSFVLYSA